MLLYVVGRSAPFQSTTDPVTKFVPPTVSVKEGPPAVALAGESDAAEAFLPYASPGWDNW